MSNHIRPASFSSDLHMYKTAAVVTIRFSETALEQLAEKTPEALQDFAEFILATAQCGGGHISAKEV